MSADHSDVRAWRLDHRIPLADGHLLGFLGSRAIKGCEAVEGRRYARSIRMPTGAPAVVEVEPDPSEPFVTMWIRGDGAPGAVERAVRRLLDLDADPEAIDATLGADPALRSVVLSTPGMRLPGAVDGFEIAVRAIVGQQVSVAGARTTLGRIAERVGEPLPEPLSTVVRVFPTPARLAGAMVEMARAVEGGELDLSGETDLTSTRERLRAIRGVGAWTEEYVAMRALGDRDAFPVTDLGVRRGFRRLGLPDDPRSMLEHAERWRPWRAYAVIHLWAG